MSRPCSQELLFDVIGKTLEIFLSFCLFIYLQDSLGWGCSSVVEHLPTMLNSPYLIPPPHTHKENRRRNHHDSDVQLG